jgi:hypothetical protein
VFQFLSEGWSPRVGLARMWGLWPELRLELRPSFLHRGEVCGRRRSQVAPRHTRKRRASAGATYGSAYAPCGGAQCKCACQGSEALRLTPMMRALP